MARHPSAALRVVLAWLMFAGPLPVRALGNGTPNPNPWSGKSETWGAWHMFNVPGVGTVYCHYTDCGGAWTLRSPNDPMAKKAKLGKAVKTPGTKVPLYSFESRKDSPKKVEVKAVPTGAVIYLKDGRFVADANGKTGTAVFEQSMMFDPASSLIVTLGQAAPAAPTRPKPPVTTTPKPPVVTKPPVTSAPTAEYKGPVEWRSVPINGTKEGIAHMKCKLAECKCSDGSCAGRTIALYRLTKEEKTGQAGGQDLKLTAAAASDYFLNYKAGKYHLCNSGSGASWSAPHPQESHFDESKFLPDHIYVLADKTENLGVIRDFKGVAKVSVSWGGAPPALAADAIVSEDCKPEPKAEAPKDPLDAKLDELFKDKVERAGADWLAESFGGKKGKEAREAFLAALSGADKDKTVKEAKAAIGKEAARHVAAGKPELAPFVGKRGVTAPDITAYICKMLPEGDGTVAAPPTGPKAMDQAKAMDANARAATGATVAEGAKEGAQDTTRPDAAAPAASLPFELTKEIKDQCAIWRENQKPPTTVRPGPPAEVPPIYNAGERPGTTPDKEDGAKDKAGADAAAKKKDLQRMAIGGMGGAIVLGVFGFIFGGPIGAIAMGALGFGLMAGVTYLNNHPIE
ncbi:MAG: hypothetical protein HY928_06545 [Elusimicrobia bacterium]|nr:hypothetical protein [Elusimicrobiota bacterium]